MRPLHVEFATQRRSRVPLLVWAAACVAGSIGLGAGAWHFWMERQVTEARSVALALTIQREQQGAPRPRAAEASAPLAYARDAQALARTASFPTQTVLRSLEATAVDGIRIQAIELAAARGIAQVQLEFDDYPALLRYVEQLNEGDPATPWALVRAEASGVKRQATLRWRGGVQ